MHGCQLGTQCPILHAHWDQVYPIGFSDGLCGSLQCPCWNGPLPSNGNVRHIDSHPSLLIWASYEWLPHRGQTFFILHAK
jgi:hypothetical protein